MMKEVRDNLMKEKRNPIYTWSYGNEFFSPVNTGHTSSPYNLIAENISANYFSSPMQNLSQKPSATFHKYLSAQALLEEISASYYQFLQTKKQKMEANGKESLLFLNSNLLYLIAVTDGNEDTIGHSQLVAQYSLVLARKMGFNQDSFLINLERGALLHDIGKIAIPETILRKPGALTKAERQIIKEHPSLGYELIKNYEFLKKASQIVLYHHERYDGQGYPYGLKGEEIPIEARIFSVADTLDTITSDRPYRQGQGLFVACEEIEKGKGCQFDPQVVDAFFSVKEDIWLEIKHSLRKKHLNFSTVY